jgi:transposase
MGGGTLSRSWSIVGHVWGVYAVMAFPARSAPLAAAPGSPREPAAIRRRDSRGRIRGRHQGRCRTMIDKSPRSDEDIAADLIAMMRASGPHWRDVDRTDVARHRGVPLDADQWLRDLLMRAIDLLAFATVRVAARQGTTYDQVVDEWEAVMAEDARKAASQPQ